MNAHGRARAARACTRCGAGRGQPCTYTGPPTQIHRDPATSRYVNNEPGTPMLLTHLERRRPS